MKTFQDVLIKLLDRGVRIYIITRDPKEHYFGMEIQSEETIQWCENCAINAKLYNGNHY